MDKYNYLGEELNNKRIELIDSSFGSVDENNVPHINWEQESIACDQDGFDKTYRPIPDSDVHIIENYVLEKGTIICRYGSDNGRFTTRKGADYDKLGLPYKKDTIEYHEYKVTEDLSVECYVIKGVVAPMFSSKGGEVQYKHKESIHLECEKGFLVEDFRWRQKDI